jgi:hypothetical protein
MMATGEQRARRSGRHDSGLGDGAVGEADYRKASGTSEVVGRGVMRSGGGWRGRGDGRGVRRGRGDCRARRDAVEAAVGTRKSVIFELKFIPKEISSK